jgi:phospholipid/cholesterol/gamma-HCH transport system substrate-binding protein
LKITREIKTAILVIASILLFVWGYSFLKGKDLFANYKTFYVEYDNVEGLSTSAPVTLNGLAIGKVSKITINKVTGKLKVEIQITTDFPISSTSVASIYEPGFIGGKQIAIEPDFVNKQLAVDGQNLIAHVKLGLTSAVEEKLAPIQQKLEKVMVNADKLLTGINTILDQKTQTDLKNSLSQLSLTMTELHTAAASTNDILNDNKADLKSVMGNFKKVSADFAKMSDSLNKADIGKTVKILNKTLSKVDGLMTDLQSGKGTAGKLLKDESLYNNLKATTKEMELLMQDVRLFPTRYINISVFGKKNKPYVSPVNDSVNVGHIKDSNSKVKK